MKVPTYERQVMPNAPGNSFNVSLPKDAVGPEARFVDTESGLAKGLQAGISSLGTYFQEKENVTAWKAINDMRQRGTQYLYNKENGLMNLIGSDADGVGDKVKAWTDEQTKDIIKTYKLNNRQKDVFMKGVVPTTQSWYESALKHEQKQFKAVRDGTFNAGIKTALDAAVADPTNEALCREQLSMAEAAVIGLTEGQSDEMVKKALADNRSAFAKGRVEALLNSDDVRGASNLMKSLKNDLTGSDYSNLHAKVQKRMDVIEVQEIADRMAPSFGEDTAKAAAWAQKNYEGEKEKQVKAELISRCNQYKADRLFSEIQTIKAQDKQYRQMSQNITKGGQIYKKSDIDMAVEKGQISVAQAQSLLEMQQNELTRPNIFSYLRASVPDFDKLDATKQEELIRKRVNVTEGDNKNYMTYLWSGLLSGMQTEDDVRRAMKMCIISPWQAEGLLRSIRGIDAKQKNYLSTAKRDFERELTNFAKAGSRVTKFDRGEAEIKAMSAIEDLDPKSPTYRKDVQEAFRNVLIDILSKDGLNGFEREIYDRLMSAEAPKEVTPFLRVPGTENRKGVGEVIGRTAGLSVESGQKTLDAREKESQAEKRKKAVESSKNKASARQYADTLGKKAAEEGNT